MTKKPDLEELLSQNNAEQNLSVNTHHKPGGLLYHLKGFVVDGISNVLFYAPIMTFTEKVLSGMEWDEVEKSRGIGAVTAFLTGYVYNELMRKRLAKTVGINTKSSWPKRKMIDVTVGMITTAPFYAPMLYFAGASNKEMAIALFTGSLLGAAAGGLYGHLADKWRMYWNLPPILNK